MSSFPENPIIAFLYWLLDTPGIGAIVVAILLIGLFWGYARVLRWISNGANTNESVYTYPTEALHQQEK